MKRILILLTVLGIFVAIVPARGADEVGVVNLKFRVSGSVTMLGNPFEAPFSAMVAVAGKGPLGRITGQGFYIYQQVGTDGVMICGGGQVVVRLDSTGDTLLLSVAPGPTGTLVWTGPAAFTWAQTFTATVSGGTGVFAGATGSSRMETTGAGAPPGFVNVWEGTLKINLDQ